MHTDVRAMAKNIIKFCVRAQYKRGPAIFKQEAISEKG